jgi:DNA-binding IclR family transcriptional regulator
VCIDLDSAQVDQVLRATPEGGRVLGLLEAVNGSREAIKVAHGGAERDRRLSSSLLAGLLVLTSFPLDGGLVSNSEIACELGMNKSTAHRYISTLVGAGLLERNPVSRRYGRATSASGPRASAASETLRIALSPAQVEVIRREAGETGHIGFLLAGSGDRLEALPSAYRTIPDSDANVSSSLMAGLLVLAAFPKDGSLVANADLGRVLGMNSSTCHRYISTLVVAGLVERDPATRKYRVAQ